MGYLEESGLAVLPWPGNSPDLNPIEGLLNGLKGKVNAVDITNRIQLIERLVCAWHRHQEMKDLAVQYVRVMPTRVAAVVQAKDGITKYKIY